MKRATSDDIIYICACTVQRKALRAELRKLTYEKIAEYVGLSETHVHRISHGVAHKKLQRAMRDEARDLQNKASEKQMANN